MRRFLLSFALFALALANAKSYTVTLYQAAKLGNMDLKPGEYRIEVQDQKAVIRNGSLHGEVPVTVDNGTTKHNTTSVRLVTDSGTTKIQEIRLGGTKTTLKFAN